MSNVQRKHTHIYAKRNTIGIRSFLFSSLCLYVEWLLRARVTSIYIVFVCSFVSILQSFLSLSSVLCLSFPSSSLCIPSHLSLALSVSLSLSPSLSLPAHARDRNFVFGKKAATKEDGEWDAKMCITGTYSSEEQTPDPFLGKSKRRFSKTRDLPVGEYICMCMCMCMCMCACMISMCIGVCVDMYGYMYVPLC